jgi:hypothetical protein
MIEERRQEREFRDALQREIFVIADAKSRLHDHLVQGVQLGLISTERARVIRQEIEGGNDSWNAAVLQMGA